MSDTDALLARYWRICEERGNGYATPILWHLALRGDTVAMVELSRTFHSGGRLADAFSQAGLLYRVARKGDPLAAQNLAIDAFNRGDLTGYRRWLARAASLGDDDARRSLKRFEVRLPHTLAGRIGRRRPERKYDFE